MMKVTGIRGGDSYKGIRQASIFIQNIDMNTKYTEEERADLKGQARFVRAYYYWLLLRKYGPVPLLPDDGLDYTADYDDFYGADYRDYIPRPYRPMASK